ncbi:MAG: QueT transporter family protein [Pseudobutyrivibrio sp.]|nr:QueT transporter family protein [Pseudobutyrivibrio sp.]
MNKNVLKITQAAMIAALYVVLTWLANALGMANGAIQVRFSEALCILPVFTPAAIPGLFVGCLVSNILNGCVIWDIVFGSIATLIGAIGTYKLKKTKFIYTLPPVIANMIVVPLVLRYAYGSDDLYWFMVVTVAIGEIISVCVLGFILKTLLDKHKKAIFMED